MIERETKQTLWVLNVIHLLVYGNAGMWMKTSISTMIGGKAGILFHTASNMMWVEKPNKHTLAK